MVPTTLTEFLTAAVVLPEAALVTLRSPRTMRTVDMMPVNDTEELLMAMLSLPRTLATPEVLRTRCPTLLRALLQLSPRPLSTAQPRPVKFRHVYRSELRLAFTPPVPLSTLINVTPFSLVVPVALFLSDRMRSVVNEAIRPTQLPVEMFVAPHVLVVHPRMALEVSPNRALMLLIVRLYAVQELSVRPLVMVTLVLVAVVVVAMVPNLIEVLARSVEFTEELRVSTPLAMVELIPENALATPELIVLNIDVAVELNPLKVLTVADVVAPVFLGTPLNVDPVPLRNASV